MVSNLQSSCLDLSSAGSTGVSHYSHQQKCMKSPITEILNIGMERYLLAYCAKDYVYGSGGGRP